MIATPCCGEAVEHGKSGFIVPPRDARSIVGALEELLDPGRLEAMSAAAYAREGAFSPRRLSRNMIRALRPDGRPTLACQGKMTEKSSVDSASSRTRIGIVTGYLSS